MLCRISSSRSSCPLRRSSFDAIGQLPDISVNRSGVALDNHLIRERNGLVDDGELVTLKSGTSIFVQIRGTGKPPIVVDVAGLGDTPSIFGYQELLLDKATFIDIDRPGIGLSEGRSDALAPLDVATIAGEYAETLKVVCDAKGLPVDDLTAVSHSFGGNITPALLAAASRHGLRVSRWLDCDGSVPEMTCDPQESATLYDGPVYTVAVNCTKDSEAVRVLPSGEVFFRVGRFSFDVSSVANTSPLNLVAISDQVRGVVMPADLQYCRITRDPSFHLEHPSIPSTPEFEDYWLDQGVSKALALDSKFLVVANQVGHGFLSSVKRAMPYLPNPRVVAQTLECMLAPGTKNMAHPHFDATPIISSGAEVVPRSLFEEFGESSLLSSVQPGTFAGVPLPPLLADPAFQTSFRQTTNRRSGLTLVRWAAEQGGHGEVVEAIDRYVSERPQLAADPALSYLPPPSVLAGLRERVTLTPPKRRPTVEDRFRNGPAARRVHGSQRRVSTSTARRR